MSLTFLKEIAARSSEYIRFNDLEPGIYRIKKTSVMDKSHYDSEKRVLLHLKMGYVILPKRFNELLNKRKVLKDLNDGIYALVYQGKEEERPVISFVENTNKKEVAKWKQVLETKTKKRMKEVESSISDSDDDVEGDSDDSGNDTRRRKQPAAKNVSGENSNTPNKSSSSAAAAQNSSGVKNNEHKDD